MPNLHRDGPSEQFLADGTRSTHVVVSFSASAVQCPLMSQALSKVGLVHSMSPKPGSSVVHVEDESSVLEALLPNELCRVTWDGLGLSDDLLFGPVAAWDLEEFWPHVLAEGFHG